MVGHFFAYSFHPPLASVAAVVEVAGGCSRHRRLGRRGDGVAVAALAGVAAITAAYRAAMRRARLRRKRKGNVTDCQTAGKREKWEGIAQECAVLVPP